MGISVIICCYNSSNKLQPTLSALAQQVLIPGIGCEIILVNNNSTDNTAELALDTWNTLKNPYPLRIVDQKISGLSYARKKGIQSSQYEYLIFCDDDNWLCKDYLQMVYHLFETMPAVALVGGVGEAVCEIPPPGWFNEVNGFGYALGSEGRQTGYVESVYGAGMAIRKAVLQESIHTDSPFRLPDRKGTKLSSGGDTEISMIVLMAGHQIYFDAALKFKHFLTANRLTWKYYLQLRRSFGKANAYLNLYREFLKNNFIQHRHINLLRRLLHLLRLWGGNFPNSFFPSFFKDARTANLVQEISMRKTLVTERRKLTKVATHFNNNPERRSDIKKALQT